MLERLKEFKPMSPAAAAPERLDRSDQRLLATVAISFAQETGGLDKCYKVAEFASTMLYLPEVAELIIKGTKKLVKEGSEEERRFNALLTLKK